ncbi:Cro/CI family transcriptional regulator [Ectopseudomonas mendocina]|uniref:Cro/CI family transcriptional regulator n=1 Tax=Ectopseudomonas mendocina TaxID=300 RepID=A0ABZ2RNN7_ECTME
MKRTPLNEFVAERGQINAAVVLGVTQGAISKALRMKREIHVNQHDDGTFSADELRPFPSQVLAKASVA